jgi:hypothetical protein
MECWYREPPQWPIIEEEHDERQRHQHRLAHQAEGEEEEGEEVGGGNVKRET